MKIMTFFAAAALALATPALTAAQTLPPDLMIVLDGSGSMWGQIDGVTKIEIARETLTSVLEEANPDQNIGMMVYGHRVRGQCSDIQYTVPLAPARLSVPQIVISANGLTPIGMTPLTESVRQAADLLRFTEQAATVVLITDGIENCEADPCALGNELASLGLDFRAHVVGFGLTAEEGAKVACLAENTGGEFILADDLEALNAALSLTIGLDGDFVPEQPEMAGAREVRFLLRDIPGGDILRGSPTLTLSLAGPDMGESPDIFIPAPSVNESYSASVTLPVGDYALTAAVASGNQRTAYTATVAFTVEAGEGPQIVDRVLQSRLRIIPLISASEPFERGLPSASFGSPHLDFLLTPVDNGQPVPERAVRLDNMGTSALGNGIHEAAYEAGTWLVRGTLGRAFARERLVEIEPGTLTELVFDFDAARVIFDYDDGGVPVRTPTFYPYDGVDAIAWLEARWFQDGQLLPLFMPPGTWLLRGGDYHNQANRAALVIDIPSGGQTITVRPASGDTLDSDDIGVFSHPSYTGCLDRLGSNGTGPCLVERVAF